MPEMTQTNARRLQVVSAATLATIAQALSTRAEAIAIKFGGNVSVKPVMWDATHAAAHGDLHLRVDFDPTACLWVVDQKPMDTLAVALFGQVDHERPAEATIATVVAREIVQQLQHDFKLAQGIVAGPCAGSEGLYPGLWAGHLLLQVSLQGLATKQQLQLVLSPGLVKHLVALPSRDLATTKPAPTGLAPTSLGSSAKRAGSHLKVCLPAVALPVSQLLATGPGEVLPLPITLSAGFVLMQEGGARTLARAHLGRTGRQRAIELLASEATKPSTKYL